MAVRSSRPALAVRALVIALLGVPVLAAATPANAATPVSDLVCAATALTQPLRLSDALGSVISTAAVLARNDLTVDELAHLAHDRTSWIDQCGRLFVVDDAVPAQQQGSADTVPAEEVPADVFDLSSRPVSTRTIYLDFDGATYSGTRWRNGETIVSPAYSLDADPTTFSQAERAQVYLAWRTVSEDYAAFDVNVTTRQPALSALTRTTSTDQTYGMPVVVTPTNSVGSSCACGGVAYIGVFGTVGATDYQPAWIFTNGSGTGGYNVGQVISHEVGHTFGLSHDGTSQSPYYGGAKGWAPIMGASYDQRASHWSKGEYADADNTEDDVAIISKIAPTLADDHANGLVGATRITAGTPTAGTLTSRTDADAFTFTASGPTTLSVTGPSGYSNVDLQVTVYSSLGAKIAAIDPTADEASDASLDATWTADLPVTAATYTAVVDGVGLGNPGEAGRYSDYGSIGTYMVNVGATPPPTPPPPPPTLTTTTTTTSTTTTSTSSPSTMPAMSPRITFVTTRLPGARVGAAYRAVIRFSGPVSEARVDWRLPQGLTWRVVGASVVIRGTVRRATDSRFSTVLSSDDGPTVRHRFHLVVR